MGDAITHGLVPAILLCVLFLHMRLRDRFKQLKHDKESVMRQCDYEAARDAITINRLTAERNEARRQLDEAAREGTA